MKHVVSLILEEHAGYSSRGITYQFLEGLQPTHGCKLGLLWPKESISGLFFYGFPLILHDPEGELTPWCPASCTTGPSPALPCQTWTWRGRNHWSYSHRTLRCSLTLMEGLGLKRIGDKKKNTLIMSWIWHRVDCRRVIIVFQWLGSRTLHHCWDTKDFTKHWRGYLLFSILDN